MKRETWRPQPTSSWAPARSDSFRPSQGESSTSGSARLSPPSGPSSSQPSRSRDQSEFSPRRDHSKNDDRAGSSRERWVGRDDDRRTSGGRRSPVYESRDERDSEHGRERSRDRASQLSRGYGRDHNPDIRDEDMKKGTFRTKAQIERDKKNGIHPPTAPRDRGQRGGPGRKQQGERSWGAWKEHVHEVEAQNYERGGAQGKSDKGYTRRDRSPKRDMSPVSSRKDDRYGMDNREDRPRARRKSPDYGEPAKARRSPSRDSLYSPLPRRRSPSPGPRERTLSPYERKRGPLSPRGGDSKRQRAMSSSPSPPPRRRRSSSRSRSRSRERYSRRRSPSPPRNGRRSPLSSPRKGDSRQPQRLWGRRSSPDRDHNRRDRSPVPPPRNRSPSSSSPSRSPIPPPRIRPQSPPPRDPPSGMRPQTDPFRNNHDQRHDQPAPSRGPPFGGWGRSAGPLPEQSFPGRSQPPSSDFPASGLRNPNNHYGQAPPTGPRNHYTQDVSSHVNHAPFPTDMRPPKGPAAEVKSQYNTQPPPGPSAQSNFAHPPFPPNASNRQDAYPPAQHLNGYPPPPIPPYQEGVSQAAGPIDAAPLKITFDNTKISPTKTSWVIPPTQPSSMRQFFNESTSTSPSKPSSRSTSPRLPSLEPDRPPLQQPQVYLSLIDENERKYSDHLRTIAPYIKAAFDQWYGQNATPDLPEFLDHYFGRRPTLTEVTQIETLLGVKTRFSKDQEELKLLHRQALDLRERQNRSNGNDAGHWSPAPAQPRIRPWGTREQEQLQASKPESETISQPPSAPTAQIVDTPPVPLPTVPVPAQSAAVSTVQPKDKPPAKTRKTNASGEVYERLAHVGEGTYGKVYKARHVETGVFYALKRIRMEGEKDGFPVTAMREIKLLQNLRHSNVLRLVEMMVSKGSVYMVLEYMDHDLTGLLAQQNLNFTPANLKSLNFQMLSGLAYLHDQGILHRDMKGSNILLNASGELKLADFGLARVYSKRQKDDYTNRVITLWYRGPELLLGETVYGPEVDMWSAGCIMLELYCGKPVFQGNDEIHQLEVIYSVMGTPDEDKWPGVKDLPWYELVKPKEAIASKFREAFTKWLSPAALDLAEGLLEFDTSKRLSAEEAMKTPYFIEEEPKMEMPTQLANCGEHHEMSAKIERHRRRQQEGR